MGATRIDSDLTADTVAAFSDPVKFCRRFLRADMWSTQEAILAAIAKHPRVAVKACHASGKTKVAALAALWFLTYYDDSIVLTTAPTFSQIEKLLWGEIEKAISTSRIQYPSPTKTHLQLRRDNYAVGISTNEGVRFHGFHAPHMLIIVDEAPGVRAEIWEAIEGARAGGDVRLLVLGNPTIAGGPFYDAFTSKRAGWKTLTISAFDTPNLEGLSLEDLLALDDDGLSIAPRPYLTTRRWVRERYGDWGEGHPLWEARVLGQFPKQPEGALFHLGWLEQATREEAVDSGEPVVAGVDVAGPGEDETALALIAGPNVLAQMSWADADSRGAVAAALAPWRTRLLRVNVDAVGIGYYLGKHLQDLGYPVRLVNVGESPRDSERYRNLKAELYWGLRLRFEAGDVRGALGEKTIGQLATIRYSHNARGQLEIESKDVARKRGVRSPDRAEALVLAFAPTPQARVTTQQQPHRPPLRMEREGVL